MLFYVINISDMQQNDFVILLLILAINSVGPKLIIQGQSNSEMYPNLIKCDRKIQDKFEDHINACA